MNKEKLVGEPMVGMVASHQCLGYWDWNDCGQEFDCEYQPDFGCDECVFVVGYLWNDYRRGKRPWRRNETLP